MKKAEYMSAHIGERFKGVVSGVTEHVLFIELDNTVEGVLPLSNMNDDFYEYFEKLYCVIGRRAKKRYTIGDAIEVRLSYADKSSGRIEFESSTLKNAKTVIKYRRRRRS